MFQRRLLLFGIFLALLTTAYAKEKKCGEASCTTTTSTQTIGGVKHNCETETCTKSCCTFNGTAQCTNETTKTKTCTPARTAPGKGIDKFKAAPPTLRR
jgi:hypothetical protein